MVERSHVSMALLGWTSAVTQIVLFREAMACLSGSELAWGIVLGVWLLSVGIGARLGAHAPIPQVTIAAPFLIVAFSFAGTTALRVSHGLFRSSTGEVLGFTEGLSLWLLAVAPTALLCGMAFSAIATNIRSAGAAYGVEALGALAGGLAFSFVLAPLGSVVALAVALATVVLISPQRMRRWVRVMVAAAVVAVAAGGSGPLSRLTWRFSGHRGELSQWCDSRQQHLELAGGDPAAVYGNGALLAWYPEPYLTPIRTHLTMLLHAAPEAVFAFGSLADGSFEHILHHPVRRLMLVENDPALFRILPRWYGEGFAHHIADPRIVANDQDPIIALAHAPPLDLIVLSAELPSTLRLNRTYTREFLTSCRGRLKPDGILVMQLAMGDTYLGGAGGTLLELLTSTVRSVLPEMVVIPGSHILVAAARSGAGLTADPAVLQSRWNERSIDDPVMQAALIPSLVDPFRSAELAAFVNAGRPPPNTASVPSAVLPAVAVTEGLGSRPALRAVMWIHGIDRSALAAIVIVVAVLILASAGRRSWRGPILAATTGAASMTWWLLLTATWQSSRGSVYSEIGILNGLFMAGLAAGSLLAASFPAQPRALVPIFTAGVLISVVIVAGIPFASVLLSVPLLMTAAGAVTGAAFPALARLCRARGLASGVGIAFAADECGAAAAALGVGLIALPVAGISGCAIGLAFVLIFATLSALRSQ